ncbi:MAG: thiamine-phosphate kinase [Pseudomonadales bacterium]|nr:thiamine-phosphate kinase [Pseudomonadales bacterium]
MGISEFELIKQYFDDTVAQKQHADLILGIGDDGAIISPRPNHDLIVAVDTLVAGVHFPVNASPYDIGYRSLAVNLSVLAPMGAEPTWFTLALTLPTAEREWLQEFSRGLLTLAHAHGIVLVGGDTTRGPLTISIQVQGYVPTGQALRRDGAKAGDLIYVTGYLGDASGGLSLLQNPDFTGHDEYLQRRFTEPQPRVSFGQQLRGLAHAAIDISDGLLADIGHIVDRSGLGARIDIEKLPLSSESVSFFGRQQAVDFALTGGDDYELCFCVAPAKVRQLEILAQKFVMPITCIGSIDEKPGVRLYNAQGEIIGIDSPIGYQHFS